MPNNIKVEKVKNLTGKLERAKAVVLTDYRGLTVPQIEELRGKVEAAGAEYEVTKNTLLSRSLSDTNRETPADSLEGPTATLFAFQDEIGPLKALKEFIKTNNRPIVKTGFLGTKLISISQVNDLADLPPREVLLKSLVGSLKSSQFGLVNVLSGNIRKLVYAFSAVARSKPEKVQP
jgi:large subunit ribosomal protein L10